MSPEDRKKLAFHQERKNSVPKMVKNSVLSWLRIVLALREKGLLKEVSYLLGVKELMGRDERWLDKNGGLEKSLKVRRVGADYSKVRGRMGDAGASLPWHLLLGCVASTH